VKAAALALVLAAACASKPAQPITLLAVPPPGPWTVMRETLVTCASGYSLAGNLHTKVEFDDRGYPLSIASPYGDEYAQCVGSMIQKTRFRADRGRVYDIAFTVP
jgi:hypothetical protein